MRFSLLLFILYFLLRKAARGNKAFQRYIGNIHNLRIMIKTADGKRGRLYIFDAGTVCSRRGTDHPYDAAIIWSDAFTGFKVMLSQSNKEQFRAAAAGLRFNWIMQSGEIIPLTAKVIRIDIDPHEINRNRRADVGLVGDAAAILT